MSQHDIGLIGLAVMGQNLVMNMANKGFNVAYPPEKKIDLKEKLTGKLGPASWKLYKTSDDFGIFDIAKQISPDVILLAHGAALSEPEDAQYMLDHTDCHGVQLGSSIERLAIEEPLEARAASFKNIKFSRRTG